MEISPSLSKRPKLQAIRSPSAAPSKLYRNLIRQPEVTIIKKGDPFSSCRGKAYIARHRDNGTLSTKRTFGFELNRVAVSVVSSMTPFNTTMTSRSSNVCLTALSIALCSMPGRLQVGIND